MGLTHFPNGIASFGMPVLGGGDELITTGNVFFVDSGVGTDSAGRFGKSPDTPFATIDYAIGQCTANNGDIIIVMPGHSEDPTTSIALDVAGVWVRGLGWGANRPTITFGAAGATFAISAASCRLSNVRFDLGTVAATVTNAINVTADDVIVEDCETVVHATSQFTNLMTCTDAARLVIRRNVLKSLHTAGATSGLVMDGCDDCQVIGNWIDGHFGEHALDNTTPGSADECLRLLLAHNFIRNWSATAGDLAVEMDAAATGFAVGNAVAGGLAFAANVDWGNLQCIENYLVDAADVKAIASPTTPAS